MKSSLHKERSHTTHEQATPDSHTRCRSGGGVAVLVQHRPYHTHDENQPLTPGQPVDLDIEAWPTSIVVPAGYRIGLTVRGKDL